MPFNAYIAYETVGRRVRFIRQTQAQVDADIGADADLSAHVGAVAVPDAVIPGYYFNPPDLTFTPEAVLTALDLLKQDAWLTHTQLGTWANLLSASALTHLSAHVNYGHDVLFQGHQGMYLVLHRTTGINTIAHRRTYCQQMRIGALDVTDLDSYYEHVHAVASTPLPVGPNSWVDPEDNMRENFAMITDSLVRSLR